MTDNDAYERGTNIRREVLGDAHTDRAIANTTEFTAPFQEFITRHAWGSVRSRERLDRRTRGAITLVVLTALGREQELSMHVRAARTNGLALEVLLRTAVHAVRACGQRCFCDRPAGAR
jgi:alkylhydroperoxidase/carboxymuconolactone decarboxylase family protein YurZ